MKCFLAATIKHEKAQATLCDFVPDLENLKVAYIPTAAYAEEGPDVFLTGGSFEIAQRLCNTIEVVKLEEYRDESIIPVLQQYDVLWFAGGLPGYLAYWLLKCRLQPDFKELFADKTYIGISAGSSAAGISLTSMSVYKDKDAEPPAQYLPGLGLLDGEFYPHYEPAEYERLQASYQGPKLYLVPDGEYITVVDGVATPSEKVEILEELGML